MILEARQEGALRLAFPVAMYAIATSLRSRLSPELTSADMLLCCLTSAPVLLVSQVRMSVAQSWGSVTRAKSWMQAFTSPFQARDSEL